MLTAATITDAQIRVLYDARLVAASVVAHALVNTKRRCALAGHEECAPHKAEKREARQLCAEIQNACVATKSP